MKTCTKCNTTKSLSSFMENQDARNRRKGFVIREKRSDFRDGRHSWCIDCEKIYHARRYDSNRDVERAKRRSDYQKNKESYKKRAREWVVKNRERHKSNQRIYMANRRTGLESDLTKIEWNEIWETFVGRCAYCGKPAEHMDHFWPVTMGGATTKSNVVPACAKCNHAKFNHDPLVWLGIG